MGLLLAAGVYLSIVYFGQEAVPNSDFPAFVKTGEDILHFRMPSSFKRVPVLGILQVAFGKLMFASPHPTLTGGLVLNGVLYTLSLLLFYRVSRFFLQPTASFFLCLAGAINPYAIAMMVSPIAETAIVFFILLTLYLILKRSRWCYAAAMLASMTRYECFGLIGVAIVFDLADQPSRRKKLAAVGLAAAASIPMVLWIIGTQMTSTSPQSHYFKHFLNVDHRNGFSLLAMLWRTSFGPLLQWPEWILAVLVQSPTSQQAAEGIQSRYAGFQTVWNSLTAACFIAGAVWAFVKKQWTLLGGVFLFWSGYVSIHMLQRVLLDRYTLPVVWLTLLAATYGLVCSVSWATRRIPKWILCVASALGATAAVVWAVHLYPAVGKTPAISPASATVVYAGLLLAAIALAAKQVLYRRKTLPADVCLFAVVALMLISNQFALSFRLGRGETDIEFRRLAEWYLEHTDKNERLATTLPGVVNLFLPEGHKNAIHTGGIPGETLAAFFESCKQRSVAYVAWDSRLGYSPNDEYYREWGLQKIHPLSGGNDIGPFTFIRKIEASPRRFIYLYRIDE